MGFGRRWRKIDFTDVLFDQEALGRLPREYVERMLAVPSIGSAVSPIGREILRCCGALGKKNHDVAWMCPNTAAGQRAADFSGVFGS